MTKIAKSMLSIAFIALVAIGATKSYFTDTEMISGNTLAFGTLDMTVSEESFAPISLDNVKPGDVIERQIDLQNAGNIDFGSLILSLNNADDPNSLLGQIDVSILFTANIGTDQEVLADLGTVRADSLADLELINDSSLNLLAGNAGSVFMSISIPTELGNEYQTAGASFDLVLNAEQVK